MILQADNTVFSIDNTKNNKLIFNTESYLIPSIEIKACLFR